MSTMRVPANTPLVSIPQDRGGGRRYGLDLGMVPQREASSAAAFGGAGAFGYDAMARGLNDVGRLLTGVSIDIQEREDKTRALEAYNELQNRTNLFLYGDGSPESGLYNRKGNTVLGSVKDTRDFFDNNVNALGRDLTPNARKAFEEHANSLRQSEQKRVAPFEAKGRSEWEINTLQGSLDGSSRRVLDVFADPAAREEELTYGANIINAAGIKTGKPPELIAEEQLTYRSKVIMAGAEQLMAKGDFGGAMTAAMDPSLSEAQRLDLVQKAASGRTDYNLKVLAADGDIGNLGDAERIISNAAGGGDIVSAIHNKAIAAGHDPKFMEAIAYAESSLNPNAKSEVDAKGRYAAGLFQFRGPAAKDVGLIDENGDRRFDAGANIDGAMRYMQIIKSVVPDAEKRPDLVAAAWHAGPWDKDIQAGRVPAKYATYVSKVLEYAQGSGAEISPAAPPPNLQPEALTSYASMDVISQINADINLMAPADRIKAQKELNGIIQGVKLTKAYDFVSSLPPENAAAAFADQNFRQMFGLNNEDVAEVAKMWGRDREYEKTMQTLADASNISGFLKAFEDKPPKELWNEFQSKRAELEKILSPEGFTLLEKNILEGGEETLQNRNALAEMYERIAEGEFDGRTPEEVFLSALELNCNIKQAREAGQFFINGGIEGFVLKDGNKTKINNYLGQFVSDWENEKTDKLAHLKAVIKLLSPKGEAITENDIKQACYTVARNPTLIKAVGDLKEFQEWRPENVTDEERAYAENALRQRLGSDLYKVGYVGREPTEDEIMLFIREQRGIRGGRALSRSTENSLGYVYAGSPLGLSNIFGD